jgi:cytochrome oxidase Cu insertion factor (SCO1/SenC/PrrC family)
MQSARPKAAFFIAALAATCTYAPSSAQYVTPPDEQSTVGMAVPDALLLDEHGDTLALYDLAGTPLILSPVFTTCPHACPAITSSLIDALDGLGGCGKTFNVLTLSFDSEDSPEKLREYRQRTGMPDEWVLATGTPDQVNPVMEAVDFRFQALSGGGFAHANAVVLLTPTLTVSGYLGGLMYSPEEVKAALRVAAGRRPLIDRARPLLIPIAAAFLLATLLIIFLTARKNAGAGPASSLIQR